MKKQVISTSAAPAAVGPYSQAIAYAGILYCSGQIAINPASGELITSSIEEETRQVLSNVDAVLQAAGTSRDRVIKCSVFVADMAQYEQINNVYEAFFGLEAAPARELVEVAKLPKGVNIEISVIAAL